MPATLARPLNLDGVGASYIRVSTDQQDTDRQYEAVRAFEKRHKISIRKQHWFEDEGWARDKADKRPAFQRLIALAERGEVQWIVVDRLDRFGTKSAKQLITYLYRLDEAGCRLYDSTGKEWTGEDDATEITALLAGKTSQKEQHEKSWRVLGGKVEKARAGEWQGGPPIFGLDVACFNRANGKELWRVVFEGRNQRVKVYPSGETERYDGKNNFPKSQEDYERLQVVPSRDKKKLAAVVDVFKRFAAESISFAALGHALNERGWRNAYGGYFQPHHIQRMLADPIYIGYYAWNKLHAGKFNRWTNGQTVPDANYEEKATPNAKADWVKSEQLFKPLIDRKTWETVQKKLDAPKRAKSPRSAMLYLAGLVHCGNCGGRMVAGPVRKPKSKARKDGSTGERYEYFCGTYFKAVREGRRDECECHRNGVFQDALEPYIQRYLKETNQRLKIMRGKADTAHLDAHEKSHWKDFRDGIERLTAYLAEHHTDDYNAILANCENECATPDEFVEACIACYREKFDPTAIDEEIDRLEAEHSALVDEWRDLPTPQAKAKAKAKFEKLEARMDELRKQQSNIGELVGQHYREMKDFQDAIGRARIEFDKGADERTMRQRAEALRGIIQRIECTFTATGSTGGGWGKKNSKLVEVTFYPIVGDKLIFQAESGGKSSGKMGTLLYSSAHSCM